MFEVTCLKKYDRQVGKDFSIAYKGHTRTLKQNLVTFYTQVIN